MTWRALIQSSTGRLISSSDGEIALGNEQRFSDTDIIPVNDQEIVDLPRQPDFSPNADLWNEVLRTLVSRPAKTLIDRLDDLQTDPHYADFRQAWNSLNAAQKTALRNALIRLVANHRYRNSSEPVEIP